jgi:hypothetical protein
VLRTALAVLIAGGIIGGLVLVVGDPERTSELHGTVALLGVVIGVELLWAISYTIWPRRATTAAADPAGASSRP